MRNGGCGGRRDEQQVRNATHPPLAYKHRRTRPRHFCSTLPWRVFQGIGVVLPGFVAEYWASVALVSD